MWEWVQLYVFRAPQTCLESTEFEIYPAILPLSSDNNLFFKYMRTVVNKQKLLDTLVLAIRVVGKKESLPVLSCVLLEIKKGTITVRATNLESGVEITIPAKSEETGTCAVPAQIFLQTIRTLRAAELTLSHNDKSLDINASGSSTAIHTIPHDEFPVIPAASAKRQFSIPQKTLTAGVQSVSYAAALSTIRPEFASVLLSYKDGAVVFAATDSFRLAEKRFHIPVKNPIPDVLIPIKNAQDMVHVFSEGGENEEVQCTVHDAQIHAVMGPITFVSRVVDATFPNYEAIFPKRVTTEATLLLEDFAAVLQKARIFSAEAQHVGFHIYPKKKVFTAAAQSGVVGEMSDSIEAALTGEDIDINFNIPYIADCLQTIKADSVVLAFAGTGKPLIVRGVSDQTFTYLVMPLNR